MSQSIISLKGKNAIVTGSTSGIGWGIAQKLASAGARVMLNGFADAPLVEQLKSQIAGLGSQADYHGGDLSSEAGVRALVDYTLSRFGEVDILVNNAGIQYVAPVSEFPIEQWDKVIAVNLSAAFHATRLSLPSMQGTGWGRIINIASAHGLVASVNKSAYVAAKHGLVGLTKVVALENARTSITCNAICPGWVLTPLVQRQLDARVEKEGITQEQARVSLLSEKQPALEFTTPEQLSDMALFLCSESARNIRGAAFVMDGGWTAQ